MITNSIGARPYSGAAARRAIQWMPPVVTLAAIAAAAVREVGDPDLWWHLATGRYIVAQRRIPVQDVFSYMTAGHRWITHEWLSDLLLYGAYRMVGLNGLMLVFAALIVAAFALVLRRCRSTPYVAACSVLLAAAASAMTWGARPQMFSLLFLSLYLYILETTPAEQPGRVWLLPPLMLLWANLHSGFVSGLAIVAVFVFGEEVSWLGRRDGKAPLIGPHARRLALVLLATLGCSLLTPNGISAALFPFGTLSNHLIQANIQEWLSPDFHAPWAWPLAIYWLALLMALARSRRQANATQLLLLLGVGAAALYSGRHVPFLSLVGAPLLAEQAGALGAGSAVQEMVSGSEATIPRRRPRLILRVAARLALAALLGAVGAHAYAMSRENAGIEKARYPAAALAYMREHGLGGRIFNTYHWGGYLIWQGYPVFIDGRAELYGDVVLGEYLKAYSVRPSWEAPLRDNRVDVILIETDSRLAVVLQETRRWKLVYRDELASVFVPAVRQPGCG